jgi:E3 ubiquitin-protein ligase TRIP12
MLSLPDLTHVSPAVHTTLARMLPLARQYAAIEADTTMSSAQKKEAQEALLLDGAPISAIELDFTLPGHPHVELRKGGRDTIVTIHNLDSYIKVFAFLHCCEIW